MPKGGGGRSHGSGGKSHGSGGKTHGSGGVSGGAKPSALGFKSGGVSKGSVAAKIMSSQGSVKSGSLVAQLQSQGAKGGAKSSGGPSGATKSLPLSALGFKPGGVEEGSPGARMMACQGNVRKDTVIAKMQKAGAKESSDGISCLTWQGKSGQSQYIKCNAKK